MKSNLLLGSCLGLALALPGVAVGATNNQSPNEQPNYSGQQDYSGRQSTTNGQPNDGANAQHTAQRLRQSLLRAGFRDVQIMPQSFLVRAKDQDGHPVIMEVNPDSMTAITDLNTAAGNGSYPLNNNSRNSGEWGGPQANNGGNNGTYANRPNEFNSGNGPGSGYQYNNMNRDNGPYGNR